MISMLLYDRMEKELHRLRETVKKQAAYLGDEYWNIISVSNTQDIEEYEKTLDLLDTACMDITKQGDIACVEALRKKYEEMFLLIIADMDIPPMSYVRPQIMAASLLIRPFDEKEIERVVKEFLLAYLSRREKQQGRNNFVIEAKDGKVYIPFDKIYYLEAREKKLYVLTDREEYSFYGTLDKIEGELPAYFTRCHRSFIVNTRKIEKVMLSQNMILLSENRDVPLSRSYKAALKEWGRK